MALWPGLKITLALTPRLALEQAGIVGARRFSKQVALAGESEVQQQLLGTRLWQITHPPAVGAAAHCVGLRVTTGLVGGAWCQFPPRVL